MTVREKFKTLTEVIMTKFRPPSHPFKLGDKVAHITAVEGAKIGRFPTCYVVVQLQWEECHGGMQFHAVCSDGKGKTIKFVAPEIVPFDSAMDAVKEALEFARKNGIYHTG